MINKEKIKDILRDNNFKLTAQRKAIIEVLVEHKGHFITAENIHNKVKDKHPKTNFSTIYRNLEAFEKIDIIHKTNISDNASVYELICNDLHHHHIICKSCGKTKIIDFCPLGSMMNELESKGFRLTDHKFELYGLCNDCNESL